MIPSIKAARVLVKITAFFVVVMFVEYIIFRTSFSMIPLIFLTAPIFTIKCLNCRTPIYDHRIAPYVKGFDLKVLEKCPVCGEAMLPERKASRPPAP